MYNSEVVPVVDIKISILWDVTLRSFVHRYQCFKKTCCRLLPFCPESRDGRTSVPRYPQPLFIPFPCHTASLFSLWMHPIPSSCIFFLTIFPLTRAFFKEKWICAYNLLPYPLQPHFSYYFADFIYFTKWIYCNSCIYTPVHTVPLTPALSKTTAINVTACHCVTQLQSWSCFLST